MTFTTRQYQARDIERLSQTYRRASRVVYVLPTGGAAVSLAQALDVSGLVEAGGEGHSRALIAAWA